MSGRCFTLTPGADQRSWRLAVEPWITVGGDPGFLFGGAGLGACIAATERSVGRATVWATSQYLSYAPRGSMLDIAVTPLVEGRYTTQARTRAEVAGREVLGAALSLGARPNSPSRQWARKPEALAPADCPTLVLDWHVSSDDVFSCLDIRVAKGWETDPASAGDGHALLWIRPVNGDPIDRPMLALMGDFVPTSIGNALAEGRGHVHVNSLDNCMRFLALAETEWVLCDVSLHGAADGFGHGRMHLFAEHGALLATASQSVIIRGRAPPP
jgi:acyl-CoA thioesterase II